MNSFLRILLGVIWCIDGFLKFYSGFAGSFESDLVATQQSAPSWLQGWFTFWVNVTTANPTAVVYSVGVFELLLGVALILGFMRKFAYALGVVLALMIWAIPEGFGGLYTITPQTTDIGTGILYAFALTGLILINAAHGPSRISVDYLIERKVPGGRASLSSRRRCSGTGLRRSRPDVRAPSSTRAVGRTRERVSAASSRIASRGRPRSR